MKLSTHADSEESHKAVIFIETMNRFKTIKRYSAFALMLCCSSLFAQLPQGPPAGSLGEQGVTFSGIISTSVNPAGMADQVGWQALISAERPFLLEELQSLYAATSYSLEGIGSFGFTVQRQGFDEFNETILGIAYARKLAPGLSMGIRFDYLQTRIAEYGEDGVFTFDLGMQWQIIEDVKAGFATFNPFQISYADENDVPSTFELGLQYSLSDRLETYASMHKTLHLDEDYRFGIRYSIHEHLCFYIGLQSRERTLSGGVDIALTEEITLHASSSIHQTLGYSPGMALIYRQNK